MPLAAQPSRSPPNARRSGASRYASPALDDDPLVLEPDGPPQAALLLRDYAELPQRFTMFRLSGFANVAAIGATSRGRIRIDSPASFGRLDLAPEALRPNCVPAVNLFETTADPVMLDPLHTRSVLRVSEVSPSDVVFDVLQVRATERDTGAGHTIAPLRRLGVFGFHPRAPYAYSVEIDDAATPHLSFVSPIRARPVPTKFVVSARILATNGTAAAQLSPGALNTAGRGMNGMTVRNVVPTSWFADRPAGAERAIRVDAFAQLAGAFSPRESLRSLMLASLPTRGLPVPVVRAQRRRIAALESVDVEPLVRWSHGMAVRGYRVDIGIDESAFAGRGDAKLFARVLHRVIARSTLPVAPVTLVAHLRIADEFYEVGS